jgi:hypothetical protein
MLIPLHIEPHPDELLNKKQAYMIRRGGKQAAEDAAIAAYIAACEEGMSKEECERVHSETYLKFLKGTL